MPEDVKFSISLPDGRQTEWDQKQYNKAAQSLFEKYPDADVKRYSAYTGEGELSPDSSYHITLRDGRETDWDAEQFSKAGASLMEKYPDAKISIVDDLTARRNRDFVHQYEYAQSKVADPSLTTAEKKQYEDFVGTHSDRYEGMKDRYGDSGEKDSFLKGEDTEPVTGYFARLKQNTKRMWGDMLYGVGELMDINSRSYTGPSKVDTGLAKEALSLLEDREKKGEKSLQLEELLKGDTSKMSPEEKEEYNHAIDVERYLALRAGASKNTGSAKDLLTREVYGDVRAKEIKEKGAKIQDENSQEGKGIAAKAADLTYLAGSGLAAIGATALGHPEIGAAIGNAAFASFAASSAGSSMRAARDAGATDEETVAAGTASAAIMYLVGRIPFLKNMKIASRATSTKAAQAMTEALSNPAVKESVMKEAGKLTKEAAEALGMTTSHYIKQILGQTASSSATFAAMNGMEALVPLIYANPEEYPVLNQVTKSVAEGAIDGAIMGALFGGVSSGSEYIARRNHIRSQMAKNGGVAAAAMDLSKGEARVWNEKTRQFEQVETPPEAGWGEILGVQKGQAQEGEAPEWVHVLFNGKYYTVKSDAIARETVTLFTPKDLDKASRDAFTSEGETRGREADTPLLRGAIRQEKDYLDRKTQYEESNGGVTETTQLDIDRNNAALEGRRDATLSEIVNKVGRQQFWKAKSGPDNSVINTVDVVTFEDGSQGYVVSEDEFGLAVVSEKGKNIISKDDPQITNRQTYDLNEYLDSVVVGQDSAAETERMSSDQADNLAAVQERLVQEGKINVGTEEAPVIGTLVDADITPTGGAYLQVEGEKEMRFVPWKEVASSLGMSLDAKTDAQIADDRLSGEIKAREYNKLIPIGTEFQVPVEGSEKPVDLKFKEASVDEDGNLVFTVINTETGQESPIPEEMAMQGNLGQIVESLRNPESVGTPVEETPAKAVEETPAEIPVEDTTLRDFRGNEIPLKTDGTVDQKALWNKDPEAWTKWNDERLGDGGADSREYVGVAIKEQKKAIKEIQKALASETDFDKRDNLKDTMKRVNDRISVLEGIERSYAEAEKAMAEAAEQRSVSETSAEVPAPVAPVPERDSILGDLPARIQEAKTPEEMEALMQEKRQTLQDYYDANTNEPTIVGTREDILQRMADLGFSERVIGQVRGQLNAEGTLTEGFHIGDMVFIVADDIRDARRARLAHLHEHWHEVNRQKGYQKVVASIPGATTEYLLAAANKMAGVSDKNGYGDYLDYPNPQQALADEVIALSMEVVAESTPENVDENLRNAGLDNQEIINFVKTIYNGERGNDQTLDSSGRDTLSGDNAQEGERQDGGDSASQPEGNLGEQGSGSGEGSIQGAGEGGLDTSGNPEVTPTLSPAQQEKGTNFVIEDGKLTSYMDAPTGQKSPSAPDETMFSLKREEDSKDDEGKTVPGLRTLADGFLAKLADKPLTPEELAIGSDAIGEMVNYMMPYLDKVKDGKRYLPEEIFGKGWSTIFKNGSYGRTMENTLICMRTLAYNDFVNAVQEKVGRPLTPTESFLASQMLYDIATDPQCLYCYVALDRKAYNGFLKTYIEQRDAVLDKYKADDSIDKTYRLPAQAKSRKNRKGLPADNQVNKLYLEYLDGRADTPSMRNRFNGWLDRIAEGTLIGMKDLTSPETRQKVAGKGASYAAQIDDAEKYAQSASWAKKQEEYRAYNGELLSMPQKVVDLLNSEYGLRFYSFSEYSPAFIVENMQMVRDAALRGLVGLAYTKEIDFAKIFAPTGININISCYGREAEDGTVVMDTKQGADWGEAQALREKYGNVGCVFVATNDKMVEWALHQPWIDVIIPFHIVRTGEDIAKFYDWTNYTSMEADKDVKGRSRDIMPTEHMNDKDTFLRLCEERGLKPRFADLILPSTGRSVTEDPDYMKLVNETRRSVNETVRIKPIFDTQEARRSFDEFVDKGGYYAGWFTEEGAFERGVEQVAADVEAGKTAKDVDYGRQDIKASAEKLAAMAGKKKRPRTHQGTPRRIGGDRITKAQQNVLNYLETGEFKSEREPLEVANATQKQPVSDAAQPVVTEEDIMFRLSKNNKATVESWLKKREDINDEQRAEVVDYIDKLDDAKTQLATAKWFANGTIRIPEDMKKVQQAISVAGKAKVDPLRYNSPMELLDAHADFKPSEERINPDEVSTLHRAAEYPEGIVVYDVDNTKESRENMRKIINTHFGEDASPWCLLQGDGKGNLTEQSAKYWKHYNAYPKQVAFKDGKLLAFSANDTHTRVWWDRQDQSHYGIPLTMKVEGDELGRTADHIFQENAELGRAKADQEKLDRELASKYNCPPYRLWELASEEDKARLETAKEKVNEAYINGGEPGWIVEPGGHMYRGNKQNGVYEEWNSAGDQLLLRTEYKDGKENGVTEQWYPSGQLWKRAVMKDDGYAGPYEMWYENGQQKMRVEMNERGEKDGEQVGWYKNGNRQYEGRYSDGHYVGDRIDYYESGEPKSIIHYDETGGMTGFEDYVIWRGEKGVKAHVGLGRRVTYLPLDSNGKEKRVEEEFRANGRLHKREEYHGSKLDGIAEYYYPDGTLQSRTHYVEGERNGTKEVFHENGKLWLRGDFKDGEVDGLQEQWNKEGDLILREEWKDGEKVRTLPLDENVQFRKAFDSIENELGEEQVSVDNPDLLKEYNLSNVTMTKKGDVITLNKVVVAEQKKGYGTRFMQDLTDEADHNGWTLALTPDDSFGATSVSRLKKFYKRFGFKENKGRNADLTINESMIRKPEEDVRFRLSNSQQMDQDYMAAVEAGDMDTAQRMVDEMAEAAGYTIRGYHGTTHDFTIFDRSKGNAEGNWGRGFYFTNNEDDAEANYAGEGPDLTNRVELLAENMEWMDGYEDMDYDQRLEEARKQLVGENPHTISAAIKMENPVVFDSRGGQQETYFDYNENYNEETDEYEGDPTGRLVDFVEAWNDVLSEWEWEGNNVSPDEILEYANYDGLTASQLEEKAREILAYVETSDGQIATGEFLRQVFERMGFDGIVDNNVNQKFGTQRRYGRGMDGMDYGTTHVIAFKSNQIKQTDPVTYDDEGKVIPLSKRFDSWNEDIRFRKANQTQNGFISNAEMALDKIKMEKATPEQWLKMLEKEGGLKAGEDKWLGLSDWLKESDKKTLTKDEVGDFIEQNRIQIEEQHYSEEAILGAERAASEALQRYQDEFDSFADEWRNGDVENSYYWASAPEYAFEQMVEKYGDDFRLAFEVDGHTLAPMQEYDDEFNDATKYFLGLDGAEVRPIDSVRLDYTTPGLSNKAEIALTVPTIDPWNEGDKIHFGDAGEGRAVAWIRFGDATSVEADEQGEEQSNEKELTPEQRERLDSLEKRVREAGLTAQASTNQEELDLAEAALREAMAERDAYNEELGLNERPVRTAPQGRRSRVLVIDEIQSKRHQEGRESGYADATNIEALEQKMKEASQASVAYIETLKEKYDDLGWIDEMTEEEERRVRELDAARITTAEAFDKAKRGIPAAPFEKNWHELAMKRMLRLAAEEGYDKIAWTTGDQQAERYGIGQVVNSIGYEEPQKHWIETDNSRQFVIRKQDGDKIHGRVFVEGEYKGIVQETMENSFGGKPLSDVLGKALANQIIEAEGRGEITGEGLRIGAEGMKGFYDDILPRFMNKYGKKWGVKVQDVALSDVYDETGRPLVMHSVDVTPEMKESVMEGQVMFRKGQVTPEQDAEYMDAVNAGDMEKAQQMVREVAALAMPDTKVVDEDGKPKVVYHGSYKKGITKFNDEHKWSDSPRGTYWFTNIKAHAETYQQDGGDLLNVFLNIKNPLIIDAEGMSWDQLPAYYEVYSDKDGVEIDEQFDTYAEALVFTKEKGISEKSIIAQGEMDTNAWAKRAKEKGYDGLIVKRVSDIYDTLGENVSREDEIADDYVVFAPNQIKSAEPVTYDDNGNVIPLSERFNEENDDIRFSLRGIIGAENAEDEVALDNLEVAEEMEKAGKDSPTIWRATGWERGADGKWRNEIPDAKQKEGVSLQKHNIASEVLDAPELFASYPQLAEIPIDLANTVAAGAYSAEKNRIVLDTDYNTKESDGQRQLTKEGIRTILHELQHAIQHIEGFAKGTNAKQGERLYYRDALKSKPEETYFAWFFSRKNSARKLNQVGRSKVIRFAENYDQSNLTEQDKEYFRNLINYLKGISDDEFKKFVSRAAKVVKTAEMAGEKSYENSAGEVEARNVERRSTLSDEKRQKYSPEATEEVSRNEQEVRFRRSQELVSQSREGGLAGVIGDEDAAELYRNVYRAIPKEIRERIVNKAGDGFLFSEATRDAIAEAVENGDPTGLAGLASNMLRDYVGPLDERTARYILWRGDRKAEDDDMLDTVKDITMQRRLQVGQFADPVMFRLSDNLEEAENRADSMADDAKATLNEKKEFAKVNDALTTIKAMSLQKEYDRKTVNTITVLAKNILKDQSIDAMSRWDISRLLGFVTSSVGKSPKTVKKNADALVGMVIDQLISREKNGLEALTKTRATKTSQSGVVVPDKLDPHGQNILAAFKEGRKMDLEDAKDSDNINTIKDRLIELSDKLSSTNESVRSNAEDEYAGLMLAQEYQEKIKASENEEGGLRRNIKDTADDYKEGNLTRQSYNETVAEIERGIRENKIERIEAYRDLRLKLQQMIEGSAETLKDFKQREKDRIDRIHHLANSDMEGRDATVNPEKSWKGDFVNAAIPAIALSPLGTLDQMLRTLGWKNVAGEGYLWNEFMRRFVDASGAAYLGAKEAKDALAKKVSEVFGKEMRWSDLYKEEKDMPTVTATWWDSGRQQMVDHELTQGQLLYIYMANKMTDGRMKLRRMGILEDHVEAIKKQIDDRFITLADWLQKDFLVGLREKYDKVHVRLLGAHMDAIENYFPLKINKNSLNKDMDIARPDFDVNSLSTETGAIIKRKRNTQDLDILNADAFSMVIEHIDQMEQWAAFAEFNRDLSTLLSYKRFRNQLRSMTTVYGSGKEFLDNFSTVCLIAGGCYRPIGKLSKINKHVTSAGKGITAAKISFRPYTALKQITSIPAFIPDVNIMHFSKNLATPWKAWKWAMENLPLFQKRWESRLAGDTRLMQNEDDWKLFKGKAYDWLSKNGMLLNAFFDAVTIAVGAKSAYETRYDRYIKDGYTEEQADKRAKQDATIIYNESQQSSEGAFVSAVQVERTALSTALTVFRNSPMGYQRQLHDAVRNGGKILFDKGYKARTIEFMKKQMVRDGLSEEEAEHAAERNYNREKYWRTALKMATFGFLLQFFWNIAPSMVYELFGKNKKKKKEMLAEAANHAARTGWLEGFAYGNVVSDIANMLAKGEKLSNYDPTLLPVVSDIRQMLKHASSDPVAAATDLFNIAVQAGLGVNPQTLTDTIVAVVDACGGDLDTSKEAMLLIMRVLQVPQSQIDEIYIDELDMTAASARKMSPRQMAERYAKYKIAKGAPVFSWAYSDEAREKKEKTYLKSFNQKVKERKESK